MTSPDAARDKFYEDLHALLENVSKTGKFIVLGDFSSRVGADYAAWREVLGLRGLNGFNGNSLLLLCTCDEHLLPAPDVREGHPNAPSIASVHLLDYVLVRRGNQRDVLVTKAIPVADRWTNHRLVISTARIRLQPRRRLQGKELAERLDYLPVADAAASVENRWCQLRNTLQSAVLAVLGRARRQHQNEFTSITPVFSANSDVILADSVPVASLE
ncbi:hypothetical protein SprV_0802591000 [Sparganum proliferum]